MAADRQAAAHALFHSEPGRLKSTSYTTDSRLSPAMPTIWRGNRKPSAGGSGTRLSHNVRTAHTRRLSGIVRPVPPSVLLRETVSHPASIAPLFHTGFRS